MSISVTCPGCAHAYQVNDRLGGKRVKCKGCGGVIRVPAKAGKKRAAAGLSAAALEKDLARIENERIAAEIAAEEEALDAEPESKEPEASAAPRSKMRFVYMGIALLAVGAFGVGVYYIGQYAGLWGEEIGSAAVKRELTAEEKLERNRDISLRNLHAIGQSLQLYASQHKGMYPSELRKVLEVAEIPPEVFDSPFSEVKGGYRYNYHRSMGTAMAKRTVVAYDAAEFEHGAGGNILYANGKVKWVAKEQLAEELAHSEDLRLGVAKDGDEEGRVATKPGQVEIPDRKAVKRLK